MNENKDEFFSSLRKGLEKELEHLKKEKLEEREKEKLKLVELEKNISEEVEERCKKNKLEIAQASEESLAMFSKKLDSYLSKAEKNQTRINQELEKKITKFYYWLFGTALVLLVITLGTFFILRNFFRN